MKYGLGLRKDIKDSRDYLMKYFMPKKTIPRIVDYTDRMSPVRSQGSFGACVGFAGMSVKEWQEIIDYSQLVKLSPQFLYDRCKERDPWKNQEGTSIRIAMDVLKDIGICQDHLCPYIAKSPAILDTNAYKDANKFKIMTYARITNLNELRLYLSTNGPAIVGISVFTGIMNTRDGYVPMPDEDEYDLGGHAIAICGFNDDTKRLKFKNSWGSTWGNKGFGEIDYEYYERFSGDNWSTVDVSDPNPFVPIPPQPLSWWEKLKQVMTSFWVSIFG